MHPVDYQTIAQFQREIYIYYFNKVLLMEKLGDHVPETINFKVGYFEGANNQRNNGYVVKKILNQCTKLIKMEMKLHCGVKQRLTRGKKMMMMYLALLKHKVRRLKWTQSFQN